MLEDRFEPGPEDYLDPDDEITGMAQTPVWDPEHPSEGYRRKDCPYAKCPYEWCSCEECPDDDDPFYLYREYPHGYPPPTSICQSGLKKGWSFLSSPSNRYLTISAIECHTPLDK